jgi:hypothetical protein
MRAGNPHLMRLPKHRNTEAPKKMIQIETTLVQATHDGFTRELLTFTPVLSHPCLRNGKMASFQAWLDEPETHEPQKSAALKTALRSLVLIGKEAADLIEKQD